MGTLVPFFSLLAAAIFQSTIISQITLLQGSADLVLLTLLGWVLHEPGEIHWRWGLLAGLLVGAASAVPFWIPVLGYFGAVGFVSFLQSRIWQAPILILVSSTLVGNFLIYGLELGYLGVSGAAFSFTEALNLVLLPSLVLNILAVLPVYALMSELAKLVYPPEVEV